MKRNVLIGVTIGGFLCVILLFSKGTQWYTSNAESKLPQKVSELIHQSYADEKIIYMEIVNGINGKKEYKVSLSSGTQIEYKESSDRISIR